MIFTINGRRRRRRRKRCKVILLAKEEDAFSFFSFDSQNVVLEIAQVSPFLPLYLHLLSFVPLLDRRAGGFYLTLPYLTLT
jgi:hypothetical protein